MKRWMCGAALSLTMVVLAGCASSPEKPQAATGVLGVMPVTIHSRTVGNAQMLKEPSVLLLNDATTLESLNSPDLSNIKVDFETQSLVVLSLGECKTGGYWAHIEGVQKLGDQIIIQGTANKPADDASTQALTYPFEAAVIDKVQGTPLPDITSVEGQEHPSDEVVNAAPAQATPQAEQSEKQVEQGEKPAEQVQKPADQDEKQDKDTATDK